MPAGACSATSGPVPGAGKTAGEHRGNAGDGGDSGFAGLLSGPDKSPVAAAGQTPARPDAARGGAAAKPAADPHEPEDASEAATTAATTESPEQLLSLLGATWPPSTPLAPVHLPSGLPPGALATAAGAGPGPAIPPSGSPPVGIDGALPLMPAMATTPAASGAAIGAGQATPSPADLAATLGLINAGSTSAEPATEPLAEPGERSPLQALTTGTTATATKPAAAALASPALAMPAEPGTGFDDAFGARIGWLADQRIGRAEIRVTPEHLGAIDIRLQIDGSRVTAEFNSTQADVRQALEASVGRLRDLLGQQGLQLAQADVGQRGSDNRGGADHHRTDDADVEIETVDLSTATMIRSRGLLDEYA